MESLCHQNEGFEMEAVAVSTSTNNSISVNLEEGTEDEDECTVSDVEEGVLRNLIVLPFTLMHLILVSPFRIILDADGLYRVQSFKLQQIICGIMQFLCIVTVITDFRHTLEFVVQSQPATINSFVVAWLFSTLVNKITVMWRFWFRKHCYRDVCELIRETPSFASVNSKLLQSRGIFVAFLIPMALILLNTVVGSGFVLHHQQFSASIWANQIAKYGRYAFFLDTINFHNTSSLTDVIWNWWDYPICLLTSAGWIHRYGVALFYELLILSTVLTLWFSVSSCAAEVNTSDSQRLTYDHVLTRLTELEKLSRIINHAMECQVACSLSEGIVYYAINLTKAITTPFIAVRLELSVYYIIFLLNLWLSADLRRQLGCVENWLASPTNRVYYDSVNYNALMSLQKRIGVGVGGICNISYTFLATYGITTVTFYIICAMDGSKLTQVISPN